MKQLKAVIAISLSLLSSSVFAREDAASELKRLTEYNNQMKTIPFEIGQLKDETKLPFKIDAPKNHKKEIEVWLNNNVKRYKAGSGTLFGDPVLIRFRDNVGYGVCVEIPGSQVYAGYGGSIFNLFMFNGELIIDTKVQSMFLGVNEVDDARVRLMNAEIDHACISIVASGIELDAPAQEKHTSKK